MNREEAAKEIIRVLQKPATSTGVGTGGSRFEQALCLAVNALRQPSGWVRTADRVPTQEDSNYDLDVIAVYNCCDEIFKVLGQEHLIVSKYWKYIAESPEHYPYWQPLPPLPETVGLEGTKINGGE